MSQNQNNKEWFQREEKMADDPWAVHQSAARTADCSFKNKSLILSSQCSTQTSFVQRTWRLFVYFTSCLSVDQLLDQGSDSVLLTLIQTPFTLWWAVTSSVTLLCVWLLRRSVIVKLNETVSMVTAAPLIGGVPCCLHGACGYCQVR